MKKIQITLILFLFTSPVIFSQGSTASSVSDNNANTLNRIAGGDGNQTNRVGVVMRFINPPKIVDGSIYLFESWKNYPVNVISKDKKSYTLNNVNFNLRTNRLVTKLSKDSVFVFDMTKIDNINILDKTFKKIDTQIGNRIFEVIFESDDMSILNFHSVKLVEGSVNPMIGRKTDKLMHRETFYVLKGETVVEFRLKKKDILNLIPRDENEKSKLIQYYAANRLSFKSIDDLKEALSNI